MNLTIKAKEIGHYEWGYGDNKHHMPILTLVCVDKAGNEVITGFLSPFRGYSFQVSASFEGQVDLGASQVVGLANIKVNDWGDANKTKTAATSSNCSLDGITKELMKGLMLDAITDFTEYPHDVNRWAVRHGYELNETTIDAVNGFKALKRSDIFKEYVDQVFDYLWNENATGEEQ